MRRQSTLSWLAPAALLLGLTACGNSPAPGNTGSAPTASPAASTDVLVTVNGTPIRASEVFYAISRKKSGRGGPPDVATVKATLEELVDQEVARQAAAAAGMTADAEYQKKLRFYEAPFVQFQREELARMFVQRRAAAEQQVDEAELRKYFDAHAAALKTELHLMQIMVRNDEGKIREMKKKIEAGATFESVAATLFPPNLPPGSSPPWDLGVMRWTQVPAGWRDALEKMKEGEVSDVIAGPKGRLWIVKLVSRKANAAVTFEQLKGEIGELIQAEKGTGLSDKIKSELRQRAKIVKVNEATPPPPTEHD